MKLRSGKTKKTAIKKRGKPLRASCRAILKLIDDPDPDSDEDAYERFVKLARCTYLPDFKAFSATQVMVRLNTTITTLQMNYANDCVSYRVACDWKDRATGKQGFQVTVDTQLWRAFARAYLRCCLESNTRI